MRHRMILPAVYIRHSPLLRKGLGLRRVGDRVYVDWRLPMAVGQLIARRLLSDAASCPSCGKPWKRCKCKDPS